MNGATPEDEYLIILRENYLLKEALVKSQNRLFAYIVRDLLSKGPVTTVPIGVSETPKTVTGLISKVLKWLL